MLRFFYQVCLHLYALTSLPRFLWQRKGRSLKSWFALPKVPAKKKFRVWVHAVSVGEAKAAGPLIRRLKGEGYEIVLTSITATGHAEVKRSLPEVDYPLYLPLDLSYVIRPFVRMVDADLFLLCETDYWPTLLQAVKEGGARICVINGKLSARSARRYQRLGPFTRWLLGNVDHFCLQDGVYADRLVSLGISRERMTVTGNLKYESPPKLLEGAALEAFKRELKLSGPVITIGSTHPGEEATLLRSLMGKGKILLVPRHPHRFDEVARYLEGEGIRYGRYTARERLTGEEEVILIDAMGVLSPCYQLSALSVVGGSFVPGIGGHNILEPLWCGSPCLFGPHMDDQPGMVELVHRYGAALQLGAEELERRAGELLGGGGEALVAAGKKLLEGVQGATKQTFDLLTLEVNQGPR
ncbi:MAG: 3-deoxy-D-manno-octulosonic acid transferase [Parachlamydiales bacterium]